MVHLFRHRANGAGRPPSTAEDPLIASTLLEHLADGVIACNADGSALAFNRRAREIFGSPEHEVAGEDCPKYFGLHVPGEERHMPVEDLPLARALRGERVRDAVVEVRPHDGVRRVVSVSGEPVTGRGRRIAGAVIVVQDITARLELDAALRLQGAVAETLPQGIVVSRADDGDIVYVNAAAVAMFGYARDELVGQPMSILNVGTGQAPAQHASELVAALDADGVWTGVRQSLRKDGTMLACSVVVSPLELAERGMLWVSVHTEVAASQLP